MSRLAMEMLRLDGDSLGGGLSKLYLIFSFPCFALHLAAGVLTQPLLFSSLLHCPLALTLHLSAGVQV